MDEMEGLMDRLNDPQGFDDVIEAAQRRKHRFLLARQGRALAQNADGEDLYRFCGAKSIELQM